MRTEAGRGHPFISALHAPLFITGTDKTGKTQLRQLLAAQKGVDLGRGNAWERFQGRGAQQIGAARAEQARRDGARVWGEQWAEADQFADEILTDFPDATFIHLLRDPRDRASETGRARSPGGIGVSTQQWLDSVAWAERNAERHPERYHLLRYEDVVAGPERTLRWIGELLGESWRSDPRTVQRLIRPESVGRYQSELPPLAIAYVQRHAGWAMRAHGYVLDSVRLGRMDSLRLRWVTGATSSVRTLLWQLRHRSSTSRPSPMGA